MKIADRKKESKNKREIDFYRVFSVIKTSFTVSELQWRPLKRCQSVSTVITEAFKLATPGLQQQLAASKRGRQRERGGRERRQMKT